MTINPIDVSSSGRRRFFSISDMVWRRGLSVRLDGASEGAHFLERLLWRLRTEFSFSVEVEEAIVLLDVLRLWSRFDLDSPPISHSSSV